MQIKDPDEKYKQIDDHAQKKAKSWLEGFVKENIVVNGITSEMIKSREVIYKRAYREAVKKAQEILYQKIGSSYEIFHSEWLSYEIFMAMDNEMKEKICSDFARYPSELEKCIGEYDLFFHKLVYHMRYREHISIPEKIGPVSFMQKNEIIADLPALPHISEIEVLDDITNLCLASDMPGDVYWYFSHILKISFIDIMAELRDQLFQYIGIKSSEICLLITEEDRQEFCKIIADQEKMTDIVMEDYRFLQNHGHNSKGGDQIHIGWLLECTVANAEKVLISLPERQAKRDLSKKVLAHIQKRFEGVPLAPVLIQRKTIIEMRSIYGKNSSRPVFESTLLFSCKAVSEVPISEEAPEGLKETESSSSPCFSPCEMPIGPLFTCESDRLEYSRANRLITD
ncbi:hypothetical protein GLOIN_2v1791797 [Rhizophagus clarus]|uniref:Uncharacterized protein n=1 Tax=Rhizophagus clarus TaxID=94130 RepID=A0A8H3LSP6_9GLOM|nr:hypothetical protein GLOIN_2v1791797 [Rhizophagus clarus]